ncbi:hypothetical protein DITRI_Ditri20bG0081900 [Diplodiscus trichospermus]
MAKKGFIVCGVAILGIVSAATGFAAEVTRIKASQVKIVSFRECSYPRSAALGLGLTAAAALLLAQIIINFATGCICCNRTRRTYNSNWAKALVFYVLSWCTFVIGFILLLAASALNDQHGEESNVYNGYYYCYVVKPGVFAGGAVLAAASVILGILYYLTLNEAKTTTAPSGSAPFPYQGAGITTGQPHFPPQTSQNPVLVGLCLLYTRPVFAYALPVSNILVTTNNSSCTLYRLRKCTFVIGFILLLAASALNDQHGEESNVYNGYYYCYVVKPGVFAGGAVLAAASVILGILYYLTLNEAKTTTAPSGSAPFPYQGAGITTGQPHFPPQTSQNPVLV